jgi:hypothetical protein
MNSSGSCALSSEGKLLSGSSLAAFTQACTGNIRSPSSHKRVFNLSEVGLWIIAV